MNWLKSLPSILVFLFFSLNLWTQNEIPERVLFIGNSYTYFWNLPQTVALMAESKNIKLTTRQSTSGGAHWGHHWRGKRELESIQKIKTGNFDAVVLQNHSKSALDRPDSLMHFGQLLTDLIESNNGKAYLYLTWPRKWAPDKQVPITKKYAALAAKTGATIVPVGPAWQKALSLKPDFPLYDDDGSHPSILGTYLSACVFFGVLTGTSPIGLPHRLITKDADGEKLYITIQSEENALFCQEVAAAIIAEFKN